MSLCRELEAHGFAVEIVASAAMGAAAENIALHLRNSGPDVATGAVFFLDAAAHDLRERFDGYPHIADFSDVDLSTAAKKAAEVIFNYYRGAERLDR